MTNYYLHKLIYSLLLVLIFLTSCNGQTKTQSQTKSASPIGQPKLIKNHFTDQYKVTAENIHCALQDKAGNLWFGTTADGVYRYDGKLFINFTMKDGLSSNGVSCILEDKSGNIWFGGDDGISRYNGKSFTSIPIIVSNSNNIYPSASFNKNSSTKNAVWSIMQDKNGTIWFGTNDGVYCYNGISFTRFLDNESIINKNGLNLKKVEALLEDKRGNIWFASWNREGVCCYDGKSLTNFKPNGDENFKRILEDKNGNLWFANRPKNVYRYDGKSFTDFTENEGIGGITAMLEDKAGNIWFGGDEDGGLWRYDGNTFTMFTA